MTAAVVSVCGVESLNGCCWAVLLLVLKAGPPECVADSMLIGIVCFEVTPPDVIDNLLPCYMLPISL